MAKKPQNPGSPIGSKNGPAPAKPAVSSAPAMPPQPAKPAMNAPQAQKAPVAFTPEKPAAEGVPQLRSAVTAKQNENTKKLMGGAIIEPPKARSDKASWPFWTGIVLSCLWFAAVFFAAVDANATGQIAGLPITTIALGISGVIAPVAFLWMIIAYLQRAADVRAATEPLRRQLQMILGTGAQAESRVRRFNEALERQLELMRVAGDGSYDVLQSAIQALQEEERAINSLAERSGKEIQRVAGIVRDNSEVLEDLLHDNRERFSDLSGRIAGHIATLDERADQAATRMGDMVDRLHAVIDQFKAAADQKLLDCAALADQIGQQEKVTEESTRRMNETLMAARLGAQELNGILTKNQDLLDGSGARLAARMTEVTQQIESFTAQADTKEQKLAEKSQDLSATLAREIAALETLTGRLESQMAAANEGLGARTAELQQQEEVLAQKAASIMQNMQATTQALDESAAGAFEKFTKLRSEIGAQGVQVAEQIQVSTVRYEEAAAKLDDVSRTVAERVASVGENLNWQVDTLAATGARAVEATTAAQGGVGAALQGLEMMIGRIFDAEKQAMQGAANVSRGYDVALGDVEARMAAATGAALSHVDSLHLIHERFADVTGRLSERAKEAEGAWSSMVDSAAVQQERLKQDIRAQVDETVNMIGETTCAMEAARDNLHLHIEAGLDRSEELMATLARLGTMAQEPFDAAVARVKQAVEQGEGQISRFMGAMQSNAAQLEQLNEAMAGHSSNAGHKAAEMLAGLDAVAARAQAIQHENMQATQDVLLRLNSLHDVVQTRMGDLSATAEGEQRKLADVVRGLSMDIHGLVHDSQTADQRIRLAASLLSEQAGEVRGKLEAQADAIRSISKNYHDLTAINENGLEEKIEVLGRVVRGASETLDGLGGTINERAGQLGLVQGQLKDSARVLDDATQTALDRLSVFNHALVATQTRVGETTQEVFARLSDMNSQFTRQVSAVDEGSTLVSKAMRQAVGDLVEQSVGLAAASQQAEQRIASLASETAGLQREAQNVRTTIDSEAKAMQARLADVLAQIESASVGLERNAVIAFDRSEGMAKRFEKITQEAYGTLGVAAGQIEKIADASLAKVEDVNKALTTQVAGLTFAGNHLAEVDAELRQSAESSTRVLNQLAKEVSGTAVYAADQLRLQVVGLKGEADGMLQRFDTLGRGLANQSLGVLNVTGALEQNLWKIRETAIAAHEDASTIRRQIASETAEFKTEAQLAMRDIAAAGEALQQRGDFAIAMVHQMAGRFIEATQGMQGAFEGQAARLGSVADTAQAKLSAFGADLEKNTALLEGTATTLGGSGQQITETLEKANFLLRHVGGQIDRLKASSQEVSGTLLQRLSEMLCTFEEELRGMTSNAGVNLDDLTGKARGISAQLREEAEAAANNVLLTLQDIKQEVGSSFDAVTLRAAEAAAQLRQESVVLSDVARAGADLALQDIRGHVASIRTTMEDEMAGTAETVQQMVDSLKAQLAPFSTALRAEAEATRLDMQQVLETVRGQVSGIRAGLAQEIAGSIQTMQAMMDGLKGQLAPLGASVREETNAAFMEAAVQVENLRSDFRSSLVSMAQALLQHLQQVQEGSTLVLRNLRDGAEAGAGEALGVIQNLKEATAQEVRGMTGVIEETLGKLQRASAKAAEELRDSSDDTQREALAAFIMMREQMEGEMRGLVAKAGGALSQLQESCDQLTHSMERTLEEAGDVTGAFKGASESMQVETRKIAASVQEAGQQLAATQTMLQKSQNTLFDVAQKSTEALTLFGSNLDAQGQNMAGLQATQGAYQKALDDLLAKLNAGLAGLGQQLVVVKTEAQDAAQQVAQQNGAMVHTAQTLAGALTQLESVNRSLGQNLRSSVSEATAQVQQLETQADRLHAVGEATSRLMGNVNQQVQSQVMTLESAAQTAVQQSSLLTRALAAPAEQMDVLNARLDKTLGLTMTVGEKVSSQFGELLRKMEQNIYDLAENSQKVMADLKQQERTLAPPPRMPAPLPQQPISVPTDNNAEALQRLRDMARQPAPTATVATGPRQMVVEGGVATPAAGTRSSGDSQLIHSLSDIIAQLQNAGDGADAAKLKKLGS